jgi:hypothetical protein
MNDTFSIEIHKLPDGDSLQIRVSNGSVISIIGTMTGVKKWLDTEDEQFLLAPFVRFKGIPVATVSGESLS